MVEFSHETVQCAYCGGTGSHNGLCIACGGQGSVVVISPATGCAYCGGTGSHYGPCKACGGCGWAHRLQ